MSDQSISGIEALESRRMLNGASVKNGVLRVYGSDAGNAQITVTNNAAGDGVDVTVDWRTANNVQKHFNASFPKSLGFKKINIFGSKRSDTINVGLTNGNLGIKTRIDGARGDDTINTGSEQDVIYAGLGKDSVTAGGGNDLVYGGGGDDNLDGGDGNDVLWGGNGSDNITGGNGDDKLGGVLGPPNTLLGGAGHDTFVVTSIDANPTNDYNSSEDTIVTKGDDDVDSPPGA